MSGELKVAGLTVAPGHRAAHAQKLNLAGHEIETPLFAINGKDDGPTLVVTAGVHGAEYAGIAAALHLGQTLTPAGLHGKVIVVPIVNVSAFRARSIYVCPLDGKNLNRVFPGRPDGTASEQLAYWLFESVIRQANYFVDLHGGDLIEDLQPYANYYVSGNQVADDRSREMAMRYGIPIAKPAGSKGSAYICAANIGIPSILVESGGQGLWPPEAVARHTNGLARIMGYLHMIEGPEPAEMPVRLFSASAGARSEQDGFYYPKIKPGDKVRKGQDLGTITDFEGRILQSVTAPIDGEVMYVVSSLAINKGDPLVSIGA